MLEFWIYFENGLRHILNLCACKHILFLIALTATNIFKDWKKLLVLVSIFTLGNLLALVLSVFGIIIIKSNLITFLTPITILVLALFNIFTSKKSSKQGSLNLVGFVTLFIGVIHGLGFSHYFKVLVNGSSQPKLVSILEFSLGIELAQIVVVLIALMLSYIFQTVFRFSKRDWILMMSSFVIGVVLPMILRNEIWRSLN